MQILFYFKCFSEYSSFTVVLVSVSYTYTSIPSFLDFRPIQTTTGHCVEFPIVGSRSLQILEFEWHALTSGGLTFRFLV